MMETRGFNGKGVLNGFVLAEQKIQGGKDGEDSGRQWARFHTRERCKDQTEWLGKR